MDVMIRWKVKPTEVERELESLAAVYEELRSVRPDGLGYTTFQLDDKVTFVAVTHMKEGLGVLQDLKAFQHYRATLDERCDEPSVVTVLHEVASYVSH
ncbi:hypothetical protein GCM10023080_095980 [Streptomyces pseudoechinosporeus]